MLKFLKTNRLEGLSQMKMRLGETLSLTLFGESHGLLVGALLEGVPAGLVVDEERIAQRMLTRRPGGHFASKRKEDDVVELMTGVYDGFSTGQPILIQIKNKDARESDYSFIPNHPRPGHQDLLMHLRSGGFADLRGGGSSSARLTAGIVAAAALVEPLLGDIRIDAHVGAIGTIEAARIDQCPEEWASELCEQLRCRDANVVDAMRACIEQVRKERNSIGSRVDVLVSNLPQGIGEPWFDGLEPALGRAYLSIPAARGVAFGQGFEAVAMTGLEHNSPWGAHLRSQCKKDIVPMEVLLDFPQDQISTPRLHSSRHPALRMSKSHWIWKKETRNLSSSKAVMILFWVRVLLA